MKSVYTAALVGVSLGALATPGQVFAQASQPAADEAVANDDIIVQARRRDELVQDVPAVINAVSADTIEKLNLRKLQDIESVVPGLSLVPNSNGIGSVSTIRGVDFNVNVSGNNGTIEFYLNDAPLSSGPVFQSMFDVGQIEVARGPQGTLKGRASPSGAITINLRKPNLSEVGGNFNITANDINGYNVNGALNVPVIGDKLGVRIAGVYSDDDGSRVRPFNGAESLRNRAEGIRASVRADPFDGRLTGDFFYQAFNRAGVQYDQVESLNLVIPTAGASPVTIRAKDRRAVDGFSRTNDQTFKIYHWELQGTAAGQKLVYVGQHVNQRLISFDPTDDAGIFTVDQVGANRFGQPTNTLSKSTSHEIRLQNEERIANIFDYVVGYLNYESNSPTSLLSATGIALAPPFANPPRLVAVALTPVVRAAKSQENSYFGNLSAHIGDSFEISGGLRKIIYKSQAGLLVNNVVQAGATNVTDERKTIYSGSIKYKINDDILVYANTGTSFRPGAVAVGAVLGLLQPTPLQSTFFRTVAETSRSYEVGFKTDLLDKKLRFNLSAYQQKYNNYPYLAPGAGVFVGNAATTSVTAQTLLAAVPVKVKGIELEFNAKPIEHFNFGGVLSYAKGKISNGLVPCLDLNKDGVADIVTTTPTFNQINEATGGTTVGGVPATLGALVSTCRTNQRSNNAPRFSASFTSEYDLALSDNIDGYLRGLYTYKGKSQTDPVNAFDDQKAFGILNLYLGVRDPDGGWEVSLYGKNITNTFKVLGRSNGAILTNLRGGIPLGGPVRSSGSLSTTNYFGDLRVTDPREFGINLRFAFGSK